MRKFLRNNVAVVTGAGRGIGAATAEILAMAGAGVVLASRSASELALLADRLASEGASVLAVPTDVSEAGQVEAMVARTLDEFGGIDILVNVAGTVEPMGRPLWEVDEREWMTALETNLSGPFHTMAAILPHMLEIGQGRIISVSSRAASFPIAQAAPYCAAKAGLNQLSRVAAAEVAGTGITVNTLDPGPTDTPTFEYVIDNLFASVPPWIVEQRKRPPTEAALLVLWLCGPEGRDLSGEHFTWSDPWVQRRLNFFEEWASNPQVGQ